MYFFFLFPDPESLKMERRRYFQLDKKQLNSYTSQWVHLGEDVILSADLSWGGRCWSWFQMSWFESINQLSTSLSGLCCPNLNRHGPIQGEPHSTNRLHWWRTWGRQCLGIIRRPIQWGATFLWFMFLNTCQNKTGWVYENIEEGTDVWGIRTTITLNIIVTIIILN